ncbi:DUF6941 family protein [Spongisporangium articulatum]|uniref:DUF6941 family protein n=1 Tax=Spongisporangium articulatum TaxID=3362603 RepID=A0ABW8AJR0_9ACTN
MKLTMLLCDHVAVAENKLYVNGGGWVEIGPDPSPTAIAVLLEVPWNQTNRKIAFHLQLLHEDGQQPVTQPGPMGPVPVIVSADLEVGRPVGVPEGAAIPVPMPINLPPLLLEPGANYYWEADINGEKREEWRLSFRTRSRPAPPTSPTSIPPL